MAVPIASAMSTTILSIVLGLAGMFGWGVYDFLGGVFSKQIGSFRSLFWSQLAGWGAIFVLALVFKTTFSVPAPTLVLSMLAAMVYSAGYLFFFKGFEKGNVSIVAATMNLWAVFTMLFAFMFMGQWLTPTQTAGVALILTGATLASLDWTTLGGQSFQLSSGVKEAALGAFFFGVFWNISELISEQIGWLLTTLLVKFGIVLFLLLVSLGRRQGLEVAHSPSKTKIAILLMGVIEAGAVALVNYGLTIGDAILITPIASALSIVTIGLAVIFLKDKLSKFQALGVLMAITGIIATAF